MIDPVIAYSARIGLGTARGIAVDSAGYAYSLIYSTYIGTSNRDFVHGIATDGSGSAYITGLTHGGFPTTPGAFQPTLVSGGGGEDASTSFAAKFGPTGQLVYGTYLQGTTFDHPEDPIRGGVCYQGSGNGIAADTAGNAYVVGSTSTNDFPTTPGASIPTKPTLGDRCNTYPSGYLTKLSPAGSSLVYSTYLDGNGAGLSVAVDGAGKAPGLVQVLTTNPATPCRPPRPSPYFSGTCGSARQVNYRTSW